MVNYVIELNTTYILKHLRNAREDYHTCNVAGMVSNGRSYNRIEYYLHPETFKKCSRGLPDSQRWLSGHGQLCNRIEYYLHPETFKKCLRGLPDSQRWLSGRWSTM